MARLTREYYNAIRDTALGANKKWVDALCPRCGKWHKAKVYWTGNTTPKFFCNFCKFIRRGVSEL
jgi:hypothetical protein